MASGYSSGNSRSPQRSGLVRSMQSPTVIRQSIKKRRVLLIGATASLAGAERRSRHRTLPHICATAAHAHTHIDGQAIRTSIIRLDDHAHHLPQQSNVLSANLRGITCSLIGSLTGISCVADAVGFDGGLNVLPLYSLIQTTDPHRHHKRRHYTHDCHLTYVQDASDKACWFISSTISSYYDYNSEHVESINKPTYKKGGGPS